MNTNSIARFVAILIPIAVLASAPAVAGSISLAWDPVIDEDLRGYRIYYGPSSGNYPDHTDVGNVTEHELSGMGDCTTWYLAVKAVDTAGNESADFSNEVSGWARPVVGSANPPAGEQGQRLDVTITGTNFMDGASVEFSNPGITVNAVSVRSCGELVADISIASSAAPGPVDVEVINPDRVFGTGSSRFTVESAAAPVISDVREEGVTGTSATIAWNTDEVSDSQVFYRRAGETTYQQTDVDPELVTAHAVPLTGLTPNTTYEYHVRSADASGQASESSPDQTFNTVDSPYTYISFEAEFGELVPPVRETRGADAFGGAWIDTPDGTPRGDAGAPAGTADFGVHVPASGTWRLWLRMYAPNGSSNSWFESVDGSPRQIVSSDAFGTWAWVAGRAYDLGAGLHDLELGGREAGARVDRVLLTDDPDFVPGEWPGGDVTPPQGVTSFTATSGLRQIRLDWVNPDDADFGKTVVRYRTDGRYPVSPADGLPLVERPAAPGSSDAYEHTGLTEGVTYRYAAFAVDGSGNVSDAARDSGTPLDGTPPRPVVNFRRIDVRTE